MKHREGWERKKMVPSASGFMVRENIIMPQLQVVFYDVGVQSYYTRKAVKRCLSEAAGFQA